ncbi:methionine--tRNA ligase [Porticoccus sp.]|nr:methionine--tRNA ligase [Porticoccus sp.]
MTKKAKNRRKILITSALPYANGSIHLGHLVEYIQTDIWKRFQNIRGHECYYVCADDAHGTAIMLKAEELGISAEELINQVHAEHKKDFEGFLIDFDNYHTTHSKENKELSEYIYKQLNDNGHIAVREITQAYDPEKNLFLSDRYIKGICPKCKASNQYGDNCEVCGATYASLDLINPISIITGVPPIAKKSTHYFFKLPIFSAFLKEWTKAGHLQIEISNKLNEWLDSGLNEWDISRDAPYFGFQIPGTTGKYFYVWLDAPIGYMASFKNLCYQSHLKFEEFWEKNSKTELYHFIGKDIINFHALFWPAMLDSSGFRTPTKIFVHGFLTVDGKKMSKSRGTFITAKSYLKNLNPEYLRYYYASKISSGIDDLDLNLEDFTQRVNSDLIGKIVNIASRCSNFITKGNDGLLSTNIEDRALWSKVVAESEPIASYYEKREYGKAIRLIMAQADIINEYIAKKEPWLLAKDPNNEQLVLDICSLAINIFRVLMVYLKPILPEMATATESFLNEKIDWSSLSSPLLGHKINKFKPLMQRVDQSQIKSMIENNNQAITTHDNKKKKVSKNMDSKTTEEVSTLEPIIDEIQFDDFMNIDLRVGLITKAEYVDGADKLLSLVIDIGIETRQILSGIRSFHEPQNLVGKMTVIVANLAPRKMRFGVSEGMVIAAGDDDGIYLISPDSGAKPGQRIT